MKEKTILRTFKLYTHTDCTAVKEYLEEMALKGWKLKSWVLTMKFEKTEPKKLIYAVEIFDKASVDKTKRYVELCEECGWEFICANGVINIFVTENENLSPIQTDEVMKYNTVKKGIIKQKVFFWVGLPILQLLNMFLYVFNCEENGEIDPFMICYVSIAVLAILAMAIDFTAFLTWLKKQKRRMESGKKIEFLNRVEYKKKGVLSALPLIMIIAYTFLQVPGLILLLIVT